MKWNVKFLLRNFRKKMKSKNEKRIAIIVRKRNEKTKKKNTTFKEIDETNKTLKIIDEIEKKTASYNFEIENFTKSKTEFRFFLLTKKRKDTNIDTNSETLKRLTIIVTVLAKSYFSTNDIAEFIDELNKRKRRILTQISEIFTKLSKRWKILFFERNFHFYDRKNSDSNDKHDFNFFFTDSTKISEKNERKAEKFSIFIEILKRAVKRFRFFSLMMKRKRKN